MKRQWHGSLFFVLFIFLWILFETPQILFFQSQVHEAQAAIAIDGTASTGSGVGTTITVSHTTGSGSNRLMLVGISARGAALPVVSGVTYNSVALSLVGSQAGSSDTKMWIYSLVAPATGTYDVVVSFSTAPTTWGAVVGVTTFTGVDPNTPLGTFASAYGTSVGPATVNVTSATNELVFDTVVGFKNYTVGAGQTQLWNDKYSTSDIPVTWQKTGTAASGTGDVSPGWPTQHLANDVGLLFVESTGGGSVSTPSGWSVVTNSPQYTGTTTDGTRLSVFYRRATDSAQTAPTITDPGDHVHAVILNFRGCIPSGYPYDVTAGDVKTPASTTTTFSAVTTTVPNTLVVVAASSEVYPTWSLSGTGNLSDLTQRYNSGTTQGNDGGIFVASGGMAAAGDTGAPTATAASSRDGHITIALEPNPYENGAGSTEPGAASVTMSWTISASETWAIGAVSIKPSLFEQEGYRFRNDDGTETTATWLAVQDTNIARDKNLNTRLRVIVNTTQDPATQQFQLEYQKSTDSSYQKVDVAPSQTVTTITATGASTWVAPLNVTSVKVECWGGGAAGAQSTAADTGRGGGGGGGYAVRTTMAVTPGTTYNYTVGIGGTDGSSPVNGGDTTFTGDSSVVCIGIGATHIHEQTAGGAGATGSTGDTTYNGGAGGSAGGVGTYSGAGGEGGCSTENGHSASYSTQGSGCDGGDGAMGKFSPGAGGSGQLPGGGGSGGYSATYDGGGGGRGQIKLTYTAYPAIVLSLSDNFADGASTTAQLTAPDGKTTSNFTAGKMQESTNPAATVDIANNYYTELEWCLKATDVAQYNDVYQFRVTANGTTFAIYTVTPQWTILSSPTAVTLTNFTATQYEEAVLLRWKTGYEVNNLGFHIYREENGQRVRLTPEPVAGSALLAGPRTAMTAGHHYSWWDASSSPQSSSTPSPTLPPRGGGIGWGAVKYWLKDIDLNGTHTMHGPVTPVFSKEPLPEKFRPELLSEIGMRLQERYHHYWKVQELKEKIRSRGLRSAPAYVKSASAGRSLKERFALGAFHSRRELRSSEPEMVVQRHLASKSAVKILVKEEGWYWVSRSELIAAGLNSKVNPQFLQLYVDGKEQPIRVIEKKNWDAIEFYGVGLDTPSTDTRVYWLVEGLRPGSRIHESKGYSGSLGSLSSLSYPYTIEKKDRTVYFAALKNGDAENFFGPIIYQSPVNELLEVRHHDPATMEDALLEVVLQGVTNVPHRVKVLLNEAAVGEVTFEGQSQGLFKVEVSQSGLIEGENLVSLVGQGGDMDISLLDSIRLTYWHTYTADNDSLKCTTQGGSELTVDGFSHPRVRVIDITDPDDLFEVFGRAKNRESGYAVTFRVPESGERTLLAFTEEKAKSPIEVFSDRPSFWHQERKGYDLIIISHRDFFDSLQPLKSLRESQGLQVALVDVEDIYDEFSFGVKSPKAIKDFLTLAKANWRRPPRFVLLVGDASFDPRNYLGLGDFDFLPTKLIDTVYLETASDDWFVDLNNDGLPEMAVGRLPVQTAEEAAIVVSKIIGYEKSSKKNEALLVADRVDNSDDFNFEGASEELRALLPADMTIRKIFRGQFSSDAQAKRELLNGINQGALLVNFIGHGSTEIWRGSILTSDDAEALTNSPRLPFFISMTCLNGFFQDVYTKSLAEALLKAKLGGAVAVWASSGLTEPDKQAVMNKELIKLLFGRESMTLGEATARAKGSVSDQDVRKTWILFGDPAIRLR